MSSGRKTLILPAILVIKLPLISVLAKQPPTITEPLKEKNEEVYPYQPLQLTCQAEAVPPPHIEWYKVSDHNMIENSTGYLYTEQQNKSLFFSGW